MKRRIGDRRSKPRFEIVGDLWGSIDMQSSMQVQNLGRGGALVESSMPLAADSVHWVTTMAAGQPHLVQMRVRHSVPAPPADGRPRYLIGVEFLKVSPAVEDMILRYLGLANRDASLEADV